MKLANLKLMLIEYGADQHHVDDQPWLLPEIEAASNARDAFLNGYGGRNSDGYWNNIYEHLKYEHTDEYIERMDWNG